MKKVGKVTHYYGGAGVVIIELEDELTNEDSVKFEGYDFEQPVIEMQINHNKIDKASGGEIIGFKLAEGAPKIAEGTEVLKA